MIGRVSCLPHLKQTNQVSSLPARNSAKITMVHWVVGNANHQVPARFEKLSLDMTWREHILEEDTLFVT